MSHLPEISFYTKRQVQKTAGSLLIIKKASIHKSNFKDVHRSIDSKIILVFGVFLNNGGGDCCLFVRT
jgi:hypothetical protein